MAGPTDAAALVCGDGDLRLPKWIDLLLGPFRTIYVLDSQTTRRRLDSSDRIGLEIPASEVPADLAALFLHSGDRKLWIGTPSARVVFVFNSDGWPHTLENELPIYRSTVPFDVSSKDVVEMASYSRGTRRELPSACDVKPYPENLNAIGILCQGFLVICAEADGLPDSSHCDHEIVARALTEMGLLDMASHQVGVSNSNFLRDMSTETLNRRRVEVVSPHWWAILADREIEESAKMEWGQASVEDWSKVQLLLKRVRDGGAIDAGIAAQAYCAVARRFR